VGWLPTFSSKKEENNTINEKIPYQFQQNHEETLLIKNIPPTYQE
jgi:hypothetical protein